MPEKYYVMDSDELKQLNSKVDNIEKMLGNLPTTRQKEYISNEEARDLLNVSLRTLQSKRDEGVLPFIKHGRRILYKYSDLQNYLNKNRKG
jgi:excisionase family DNA binding protein